MVYLLPLFFLAALVPAKVSPSEELSGQVIVFHAGSLSVPFETIEKNFESQNPGVDIMREAAGSTACARKITELNKPCDILASADWRVINRFLIGAYTDNNIRFASNQMVLAYTKQSRLAEIVNRENWYEILAIDGVIWGHSDPNLDPCGYRSLLVLQLAEKYYQKPGLSAKLIANRPEGNIRPKSVELVSLLQTGNMDYAWEYRSVAVQHGLKYIELPPEINLGDPAFADFYKTAQVEVTGKKPGTRLTINGSSITYGVALLKKAPNYQAAVAFLRYLLSPDGGLKILNEMGQPPFVPPLVQSGEMLNTLPETLQPLVRAEGD